MTRFLLRTDLSASRGQDDTVHFLDWAAGRPEATIHTGDSALAFLDGWTLPRQAADLLLFGAAVYCADKIARRAEGPDRWTRDLELLIPVGDEGAWGSARWDRALSFLTGDNWVVEPYYEAVDLLTSVRSSADAQSPRVDAVCLFSGGLDSLAGAIDLLEEDHERRLCLVAHNEGGKASTAQHALHNELATHYGKERIEFRRLYLRPAPQSDRQERPLPVRRETTTRARSILFLSMALAIAAASGSDVPVYVPENGFIGVNVPLTRARAGSLSTRTTHPHFIGLFETSANAVGIQNPLHNPFRFRTKGEVLAASRNVELLHRLAPLSVSCAHPEAARWVAKDQGNCGYCFPCLIRRAAMAQVGWDDGSSYSWDALTNEKLLNPRSRRAADLRAVLAGSLADRPDRDVLRNGPLPSGERQNFLGVWRRGVLEIRSWLMEGATGSLAKLVAQHE